MTRMTWIVTDFICVDGVLILNADDTDDTDCHGLSLSHSKFDSIVQ